jgi:chromosome partitioning protein
MVWQRLFVLKEVCYNAFTLFLLSTGNMVTRRIVVANQKGGVGKTTTVANLGAALAAFGKRVLLIDLDPQAALTATYGIDPYNLPRSIYTVLLNETSSLARILQNAGHTTMAIAPASIDLAAADLQLVNADGRAYRLKEALDQTHIPFDYILMDTPPSLGLLTLNGLVAATEVMVPVQCHYLSMRGVRALMETVWRVKRRLNPRLRLLGLLPTMYDPNSRHASEVERELRQVFGRKVFNTVIKNNLAFAEAPVTNQALVDFDPLHEGADAYRKLAEEIIRHE